MALKRPLIRQGALLILLVGFIALNTHIEQKQAND
jgi:hypothetical protein